MMNDEVAPGPRATDPITPTFATIRLRERVTKGAGSRSAGLALAYKNAPHLVATFEWTASSSTARYRSDRPAKGR